MLGAQRPANSCGGGAVLMRARPSHSATHRAPRRPAQRLRGAEWRRTGTGAGCAARVCPRIAELQHSCAHRTARWTTRSPTSRRVRVFRALLRAAPVPYACLSACLSARLPAAVVRKMLSLHALGVKVGQIRSTVASVGSALPVTRCVVSPEPAARTSAGAVAPATLRSPHRGRTHAYGEDRPAQAGPARPVAGAASPPLRC
jgi:hypothetical protein